MYTDGPSEPRKKRADRVRYDDMEDDKDDVFNDLVNDDDRAFLPKKKWVRNNNIDIILSLFPKTDFNNKDAC